ncbi:pilus assembly protein PilP [Legionella jamestowniensis]|nr:pilus assembly protein PilP [Legionella jamestowniensis]
MTTSCSDADYKLTHYFQMIKNRKTVFHEDTPLYKSLEKFSYPLTNKRNPFIYGAEKNREGDENSSNQILNKFMFNSLMFVGLLHSSSKSWVLVKEPNGKVLVVKPGDHIGKENVELIKIKNEVLLFKTHYYSKGKWQQHIVKILLKNKDRS